MSEHPDEGTIHAWLDDALGGDESARIAAHVAGCSACAAAVAEARGLIAGASRVVRSLDSEADASQAPAWGAPDAAARPAPAKSVSGSGSLWRMLRVTPARAAIAATLIVAAGIALTRDWVAQESYLPTTAKRTESVMMSPAYPAPPRDSLLDSALARNIAKSSPPRALEATPGLSVPAMAPAPSGATVTDATAPARVAEGRREMAMAKAAPGVTVDHVAAGAVAGAVSTAPANNLQARMDGAAVERRDMAAASQAMAPPAPSVAQCLRVESPVAGARWGTTPLPVTLTLLPTNGTIGEVKAKSENGAVDSSFATWKRQTSDSIVISLRRIGYMGSMQIALDGDERGGVMRSGPVQVTLSEVVVTGPEPSRAGGGAKSAARRARPAQAVPAAPSTPAGVEIRARVVGCR